MIYVISKATFGSYNVRDIQCNANWCSCPYSEYALIPDSLVDGILATKGYCDIVLTEDGSEVASFTAREIPDVPEECCGANTVLSVNGVSANTEGEVTLPQLVATDPNEDGVISLEYNGYVPGSVSVGDAVLYTEQNLTAAQKAQARANIGAATVEDVLSALPTWEGGSY